VSVINKMLQELDKRHAASMDPAVPPGIVKPVKPPRRGREWFWRILAAQMIAAVGWVGWVAWQLQLHPPLATDAAHQAAAAARKPAPIAAAKVAAPAPLPAPVPAAAPATAPAAPAPAPAAEPAPAPPVVEPAKEPDPEPPKAAKAVQAPAPQRPPPKPEPAKAEPAKAAPVKAEPARAQARLDLDVPQAKILPAPPSRTARVEKHDLGRPGAARAEAEFRRAVGLLNQARVSEAEDGFVAALGHDASHEGARQALVSLLLERSRVEDARRLMQEGLAINPESATLAIGLARLYASRRDYANALDALKGVQAVAGGRADYHALAGTILQRMGRNKEAVDSYSSALKIAPGSGTSWVGMAISLEALERRGDAAESFRRAVATGSLAPEVRDYAEQRARSLQ
jgi:MSHA biogenesis protein MshN